ncbi:MAG TPA: rhomboid family intramembrane serine protease, partial [Verrucomicrobiota bacterium]|nr:rhomboid family intramembrane serine protease [Verrucomicrobiota bacterium]
MESVTSARVPASSRQQAMDWSLVLASQGIDCAIDFSPELGWGLVVSAENAEPALDAIRRFHRENRRWPWRREIRPALTFDWGSVAWVLLMAAFMWLSTAHPIVRDRGMMDARAVSEGEWWRLFTATFLHGDLGHLAMNAALGAILLGLVMGSYGTGVGLLVASMAGVLGNVATWLAYADHYSLGASGVVTGC